MNNIHLACYHGKAKKRLHRLCDNIIKFFTRGKYSHCELAIVLADGQFECYSSSYRDGGVRKKCMKLPNDKWDLLPLNGLSGDEIRQYFNTTQGKHYDVLGVLGYLIGVYQHPNKFFCSEWCYNAIFGSNQGFRFSPVQLAEIASHLSHLDND